MYPHVDTFSIFDAVNNVMHFSAEINSIRRPLWLTRDVESYWTLPFLDVLVERRDGVLVTSIFFS